jgi:mannose-6-phosphate isomerase-like protein (cupin superfamily)
MTERKLKAFWFHYNKPESRKHGKNILTVHYEGKCHIVEDIKCNVPTETRHRNTQPYCVLAGKGNLIIKDKKAFIYE